jgi:hypothetical protein
VGGFSIKTPILWRRLGGGGERSPAIESFQNKNKTTGRLKIQLKITTTPQRAQLDRLKKRDVFSGQFFNHSRRHF